MVFGEPDIEVRSADRTRGRRRDQRLDVYDPTTGQVRSSSTDDIACWFLDTDYDGESFFVRHAYFTGADDPYDSLQPALVPTSPTTPGPSLYSHRLAGRSHPRNAAEIAVKVINHYGDEVMKVFYRSDDTHGGPGTVMAGGRSSAFPVGCPTAGARSTG